MKLLRLKITDPAGFRSLQAGFEFQFRTNWHLQEEFGFAPFVCAGPNGSGKSNLLEALAAIFFQLEVQRLRRSFLPASFVYDEDANPKGFKEGDGKPNAFELDYLIKVPSVYVKPGGPELAFVRVTKELGQHITTFWANQTEFDAQTMEFVTGAILDILLPEFVLGYSSGENEILSLPFFKMRFVQFDEYWQSLTQQLSYSGRPESRLVYLDPGFSQAILLCNLLFHKEDAPNPFRADVKIQAIKEFRIIIRRSIDLDYDDVFKFDTDGSAEFNEASEIASRHPALVAIDEEGIVSQKYRCKLINLLHGNEAASQNVDGIINRLIRCATCHFVDESTDTLYLDYFVNEATREAFRDNFDFEINKSPIGLFQAFQVLLTLNLYTVSDDLKADLYQSESLYVSETVPVLASDQRIMRFKNVLLTKTDVAEPVLLKSLSDGEHQLLHSLGLCLLFKNTESLFLLDEPETHFNPDWRANFISRLHQSFDGSDGQEMLITTHTPFLISDSKPENVLVFEKDKSSGEVSIRRPDYNTLGASINKITMSTFGKRETIGGHAHALLEGLRARFEKGAEDKEALITEIDQQLGDSVEKVLLIKAILSSDQPVNGEEQS